MTKLRILDLFSGIGGFSLGLERTGGFETVAFCEIEEFPRKILAKHWQNVPIYKDVRTLDATQLGRIDVICGGYPCQPFSHAGKRLGAQDDRHLWPEMRRLIKELRPAWVIGENVAGHISMGLDDVLSDLDKLGYATQAFVIPACAVNAPHRRDRVWIVGNSDKDTREQSTSVAIHNEAEQNDIINICNVADPSKMFSNVSTQHWQQEQRQKSEFGERDRFGIASESNFIGQSGSRTLGESINSKAIEHWETNKSFDALGWPTEPAICGADDGLPSGLVSARLAALGNAVVPQIPEMIGYAILNSLKENP